ncbi:MAG: hypothetical protein CVV23_12170 [Ignavibacteriae bacterium HGW-Ignavibacteriae-2]|jgi:hypothetical protein|nr:MAG: hypothetical protein CVV23_12170 [Ignavibacteriae bacterium HGW-Ignavibacteriae-2]
MKNLFLLLIMLLPPSGLYSQNVESEVFETITLSAGYNKNISMGELNKYWNADKGASLKIESPFYAGLLGVGVDGQLFTSNSLLQPDYKSFFIYMYWQYQLKLLFNTSLRAGVKFGSYVMIFNDVTLSEFESNESELGIGASFQYDIPVSKIFTFYVQSDFVTVFTMKRIKLFNAGAGVSYNFTSPEWIKDILN